MSWTKFKSIGHSAKNLSPSQKTLRPPWCPKLVTGLPFKVNKDAKALFSKFRYRRFCISVVMRPACYLLSPHVAHRGSWVWDPCITLCEKQFWSFIAWPFSWVLYTQRNRLTKLKALYGIFCSLCFIYMCMHCKMSLPMSQLFNDYFFQITFFL